MTAITPSNNKDDGNKGNAELTIIRFIEILADKLKDKFVRYKDNPIVRDLVLKYPEIGMPLDIVLAWIGQKVGEQRIGDYMINLFDELDQIQQDKIDRSFFDDPTFLDIFIKASENSLKTRHRERILLNCKILAGAINIDKKEDRHYAEDFLNSVADLTPTDIAVGFEIYKLQKHRPIPFDRTSDDNNEGVFVENSGVANLRHTCKIDELDFDIALHKLAASGLIKQTGLGFVGNMDDRYVITPTFLKLMNFIQLRANYPLFSSTIPDPRD